MMSTRRRAVVRASVLVAGATVLAGCSLIPVEENTFESSPLPAISDESADTVIAEVDAALNAANTARDPALLAEVAAAPRLDIGAAMYALDTLTDPEDATPATPIDRADPTVFIPRFTDYPQWFVVAAAGQEGGVLTLDVLTRDNAAASWFSLISPELLPEVEFPVLALDEAGYVVPVDRAALDDLPIDAAALAEQHVAGLNGTVAPAVPDATASPAPGTPTTTGATPTNAPAAATTTSPPASAPPSSTASPSGTATTPAAPDPDTAELAAALAADPWTVARRTADAGAAAAVGAAATVTSAYTPGAVLDQALQTEDGGALVFYSLGGSRTYAVTPTYFLELDATTAAIVGAAEVKTTLVELWAAQLAVYIPPDADGAPRVVAATWNRTGLTGS